MVMVQLRAGIVREFPVGRRGGRRRRGGADGHHPSGGRGTCCAVRLPGVGARVLLLSAFAGGQGGSLRSLRPLLDRSTGLLQYYCT